MKRKQEEGELVEQKCKNKYGDGVAWLRGAMIGKGSYGSVFLATLKKPRSRYSYLPPVIAVKSAEVSVSCSIQKEREVLNNVKGCPNLIRCFGEETTRGENGEMAYNLLLEYGSGGTLADLIKKSDGHGLPESEVRYYTRSILRGLYHIHDCGYVHCDLKPDNILLVPNSRGGGGIEFRAKIGDLGLAKRAKQNKKRKLDPYWRGTPMYLSPEAVADGIQEPRSDIWALGCIVLEMLTGKPPWEGKQYSDAEEVLSQIGEGHDLPKIPSGVSKEAKNFLKGCFVRKAMYRLTAEMLLNEPFAEGLVDDDDDDGVEELVEVLDVNAVSSFVLAESDDENFSSFSGAWSFGSEEESFSYWSEEDEEDMDNEVVSSLTEEPSVEVRESMNVSGPNIDGGFDHVIKTSMKVSSQVPSNAPQQYAITFSVPAGV